MIVKIFHEYVNQAATNNVKEDLQKLEDKINIFAGQKGVVIHEIKYEIIQNLMYVWNSCCAELASPRI